MYNGQLDVAKIDLTTMGFIIYFTFDILLRQEREQGTQDENVRDINKKTRVKADKIQNSEITADDMGLRAIDADQDDSMRTPRLRTCLWIDFGLDKVRWFLGILFRFSPTATTPTITINPGATTASPIISF